MTIIQGAPLPLITIIFFYAVLAVLAGAAIIQFLFKEHMQKIAPRLFLYSVLLIGAYLIYITYLQFQSFRTGPLGTIIGKKETILWFLGYVRLHYWDQYLVSLAGALLFFLLAGYFNNKQNGRFFEPEERWLGASAIFLLGYPGWIFYVVAMLIASALASAIFMHREERLPLYRFWMPTAVVIWLAIGFWASHETWWTSFRF